MEEQSDGRGARLVRPLVVALGLSLALLPAACGGLTDGQLGGGGPLGHHGLPDDHGGVHDEYERRRARLPATPDSAVTLSPNVYEVVAGDYWYGIAKKLNVDVNALWAANNADSDTFLSPGRLAVPQPGDTAADGLAPPAAGGDAGTQTRPSPLHPRARVDAGQLPDRGR